MILKYTPDMLEEIERWANDDYQIKKIKLKIEAQLKDCEKILQWHHAANARLLKKHEQKLQTQSKRFLVRMRARQRLINETAAKMGQRRGQLIEANKANFLYAWKKDKARKEARDRKLTGTPDIDNPAPATDSVTQTETKG